MMSVLLVSMLLVAVGPDTGKIATYPMALLSTVILLSQWFVGTHGMLRSNPTREIPLPIRYGSWEPRMVALYFTSQWFPFAFLVGDESNEYEESLTYVVQSVDELPAKYSTSYDATSGYLTVTNTFWNNGKSSVCGCGKTAKNPKKEKKINISQIYCFWCCVQGL